VDLGGADHVRVTTAELTRRNQSRPSEDKRSEGRTSILHGDNLVRPPAVTR
jgi:hypothetical protein